VAVAVAAQTAISIARLIIKLYRFVTLYKHYSSSPKLEMAAGRSKVQYIPLLNYSTPRFRRHSISALHAP